MNLHVAVITVDKSGYISRHKVMRPRAGGFKHEETNYYRASWQYMIEIGLLGLTLTGLMYCWARCVYLMKGQGKVCMRRRLKQESCAESSCQGWEGPMDANRGPEKVYA